MIVVYYGVNLSLSLPFCLSVSLLFPSLVLCLCPNPHFHFLHRSSINLFQPLPLPSASSSGLSISPRSTCSCFTSPILFPFLVLCWPHCLSISPSALLQPVSLVLCLCPDLHSPSLPHAIFLHLEIVPILPLFHFSPFGQSLRDSFFILSFIFFRSLNLARPRHSFSSGLYFCAPDILPVANIVFLPPPLIWLKRQFVLF